MINQLKVVDERDTGYMKYNFDKSINRYGTNSIKYDFAAERGMPEGLLPMWVADMDFASPPEIIDDLREIIDHGIFGYSEPKQDYYDAIVSWFCTRFDYLVKRDDIVKSPGSVFALAHAVRAFTSSGDSVMVQTPVYYPFYSVIRDNDRKIVTNPLIFKDGRYSMDFEDFERKAKKHAVKVFILCNPHNPIGRVWLKEELKKLAEICKRLKIMVISDEIHCDFTYPGHIHTVFGNFDENAVICTAPSKTFNLAGLQTSNLFIRNKELRKKFCVELDRSGYSQMNMVGIAACKSAYQRGAEWLDELRVYLAESTKAVRTFLTENLPKIKLIEPEGTYLLWLDFSAYNLTQHELDRRIIEGAGLWLDSGTMFGTEGTGFQRLNIACPKAVTEDALHKLEKEFK